MTKKTYLEIMEVLDTLSKVVEKAIKELEFLELEESMIKNILKRIRNKIYIIVIRVLLTKLSTTLLKEFLERDQ